MKVDIKGVKEYMNNNIIEELKYFDSVTSTNELALNMVSSKIQEGDVIIGGEQTKGRGRLKRNWYSPQYLGLWFSIIVKPAKDFERIPLLTLIGALSVQQAIKNIKINSDLKWPNDILYNNKKVGGVLSQFRSDGSEIDRVVVGIGLNVNQREFPEELQDNSISLRMIKGTVIEKEKLLADILDNFSDFYKLFKDGEYSKIICSWKKEMSMLNKQIIINSSNGNKMKGKVVDISNKGELIIENTKGVKQKFIAGDVSIDKNSLRF